MYKDCKTIESTKRQRDMADAFLSLLCTKTFSSITVNELCGKCGVPRKTFYRYFDSKDDVFNYLADTACWEYEEYQRRHSTGSERTTLGDVENLFRFWLLHRRLLDAVRKSQMSTVLITRIAAQTIREKNGLRMSSFQDARMQEASILFALAGIFSLLYLWSDNGFQSSPHEMALVASRLLTEPLFKPL